VCRHRRRALVADLGSKATHTGWTGKARQKADNEHHLPILGVEDEPMYTDNYAAIAARLDQVRRGGFGAVPCCPGSWWP